MITIDIETLVIGAGLVGLSLAYELVKKNKDFILIEQHPSFCVETSSRNSEVIHAGIYYKKNSLKSKFCIEGNSLLYEFCQANNIPYKKCGKHIVSTELEQDKILLDIQKNAFENDVHLTYYDKSDLKKIPKYNHFYASLYSPNSGIIDSHQFAKTLYNFCRNSPHCDIVFNTKLLTVVDIKNSYIELLCEDTQGCRFIIRCRNLLNSGGLHSANIAEKILQNKKYSIKPCRGHYFSLSAKYKNYFDQLIYPIPDVAGGLGLHITIDLEGNLKIGPDVDWSDSHSILLEDPAFYSFKNTVELQEKFFLAAKRMIPSIQENEIHESYIGFRPKLFIDEKLYDDFLIVKNILNDVRTFHFLGIESPGLTSCLAIAKNFISDFTL